MQLDAVSALLQSVLAAPAARARPAFDPPPAAAPAGPQPGQLGSVAPSVAMLVTLSAAEPAEPGRGTALAEAARGLDGLDALRRALVHGAVPAERIRALRDWARTRRAAADPELAALEKEIELRILVELAKLERRQAG